MPLHSSTPARVAYESPEGRVRVERESPTEFALFLDGQFTKMYPTQAAAEITGGVWLHEQAEALAVQLADEAADAALTARENALAERCFCFRNALLNGGNERVDCLAAGRCLDEHPTEPRTLADVARERHQTQPAPELDPWDDGPEPYADTPMSPERAAALDSWLKGPPPAPQPFAVGDLDATLAARRASQERHAWLYAAHAPHAAQDADGNVNWGSITGGDDEPPPPAGGAGRVRWRWQETAQTVRALIAERRAA